MSVPNQFNLRTGQRAERKLLVTVAEWADAESSITNIEGTKVSREILGTRTEDSSIEYNAEVNTSTDIRGNNYTDIDRTQPQQDFDPYLILGGSKLGAKLNDIRRRNALSELDQFAVYVITMFVDGTVVSNTGSGYQAERHNHCTIAYNSMGGDSNVNFPISVYLSNDLSLTPSGQSLDPKGGLGYVDKIAEDFTFTRDVTV